MAASLLALDLGSSRVHAVVVDRRGVPLGSAEAPLQVAPTAGESELSRQIDPRGLLDAVASVATKALNEAKVLPGEVEGIGVTGQRQGIVFMDRDGAELLVSPNLDLRAVFEGLSLEEEFGPELRRVTGHYPPLLLAPARLRWLQAHRPHLYDRLSCILTLPAWLVYRLTGAAVDEPSLAAAAGLLDVSTLDRPSGLLGRMNFPATALPPLLRSGEVAGRLTPGAAARFGLNPGTTVTLAGADTQCGMLGMGLASPGEMGLVTGWSCAAQLITETPCYDADMDSWLGCFPLQHRWVLEANLGDAGNAHRWLKGLLLGDGASWQDAERLADGAVAPEGHGTWAFLGPGPATAAAAGLQRGGLLFPTPLSYRTPQAGELFRAFWEGLCFSLKANLKALGQPHGPLHLGGGMSRSKQLAQTLASVLDTEVRRSEAAHVSALGAALAAATAAGLCETLEEAVRSCRSSWECFQPDAAGVLEYQDRFQEWTVLYHRLQDEQRGI